MMSERILILTGYDDAFAEIGDLTTPIKAAYAQRHGYEFRCVRDYEPGTHPSWQKLRLMKGMLPRHDWIFWMDADGVVTNAERSVEEYVLGDERCAGKSLIASLDWAGPSPWNAGHFLIRNTPGMLRFLEACLWHEPKWGNCAFWDQSAMQEHIRPEDLAVLPRRMLMAVPRACRDAAPEPWEPGDFIAHCTMDDQTARLEIVRGLVAAARPWAESAPDVQEMDHRHVGVVETFLHGAKWVRGMEIGCWKGRSTKAFVHALGAGRMNWLTLCDLNIREEVRRLLGNKVGVTVREVPGSVALGEMDALDVVLLDNGHSLTVAEDEWAQIRRLLPRAVILHDVTAPAAGHADCEGPGWMLERLIAEGYAVEMDTRKRDGERTDRGLAIATREDGLQELAWRAFKQYE